MIKLYGSMRSSAARCFWALEEAGVKYEMVSINFQDKEHKSPEYMALNPNGKVPTLVDGDFILWESLAIDMYIARKYKPELLGSSTEDMAKVDQWTYWGAIHLQKYIETVMYFAMFARGSAEGADQAKQDVIPYLQVLDAQLQEKEYLVANTFTLADLHIVSILNLGQMVGFDFASYTNIARYLKAILARPAYLKLQNPSA